jgi:hypothetical protein
MKRGTTIAAVMAVMAGVVLAGASPAAAPDYAIKLDRPEKVGAEYRLTATGRQSGVSKVTVDGKAQPPEKMDMAVDFDAAVKVLEVDKNGEPSKITLTMDKCSVKEGETAAAEVLPKGTVVSAFVKGMKTIFEVNGKAVEPATEEALKLVIHLGTGGSGNDAGFGTNQRKKVGEQWPINAEVAAQDAQRHDIKISKDDIKGTVKLVGAVKVGATECLDIQAEFTADRIKAPLPPGVKLENATLKATFAGKFPVDASLRAPEVSESMEITMLARSEPNADGPTVVVEVVMKMNATTRLTALAK